MHIRWEMPEYAIAVVSWYRLEPSSRWMTSSESPRFPKPNSARWPPNSPSRQNTDDTTTKTLIRTHDQDGNNINSVTNEHSSYTDTSTTLQQPLASCVFCVCVHA